MASIITGQVSAGSNPLRKIMAEPGGNPDFLVNAAAGIAVLAGVIEEVEANTRIDLFAVAFSPFSSFASLASVSLALGI